MTDLSIIIPVFNRERTIEKCIDSVLESLKGSPDFSTEIILIDDGSEDRSAQICRKYVNEHGFITLIENEHGGVSKTRNTGINAARGEYLAFIDSDDCVGSAYIEQLKTAIASKPNMALFSTHYILSPRGELKEDSLNLPLGESQKADNLFPYLIEQRLNACWDKIYRTEIIKENGIRFNEKMAISEDYVFVLNCFYHVKTVSVYPTLDYHYLFAIEGYRKIKPLHIRNYLYAYSQTANFIAAAGVNPSEAVYGRYLQLLCEFMIKLYSQGELDAKLQEEIKASALYQKLADTDFKKAKSKVEKFIITKNKFRLGKIYLNAVFTAERILK